MSNLIRLLTASGGQTAVCQPNRGGGWKVQGFTDDLSGGDGTLPDIYISVNPVDPERIKARNPHGRGSKNHRELTAYRAAHADLDIGKPGYPPDAESVEKVLASLPVQPSVLVFTGGGMHGWWIVDDPIPLAPDDDEAWAQVLDIEARWKFLLTEAMKEQGYVTDDGEAGIDRGTFDVSRVLRLPGTTNTRRGTTVEEVGGTGEAVPTADFLAALPKIPAKEQERRERRHRATQSGPLADDDDVLTWLEAHAVQEKQCKYGRSAVTKMLAEMREAGDRHPTAVKLAVRMVGLANTGCCWTADLEALEDAFLDRKPEADDTSEWRDIMRWAVSRANPREKGCDLHALPEPWDGPPRAFTRYSVQRFPIEALPEGMRAAAEEVSASVAVPVAMPATAFLGIASGLIGSRLEIAVRTGWARRANLYLCMVADSASGKTPAIVPALAPLMEMQNREIKQCLDEQRGARATLPGLREKIKAARKAEDGITAYGLQEQIDRCEEVLKREPRLMVDDITPERLAELMHHNSGRMIAVNDEGSILAHALGMYAKQPNVDLLLKGADASQSYIADRKGGTDGPSAAVIHRPTITLLAAVQPSMVDRIGAKPELIERGLVGRVMWSWPEDWAGRRMLSGRVAATEATDAWNAEVLALAEEVKRGVQDKETGIRVIGRSCSIAFSDAGLCAFLAWHDEVEAQVPTSEALGDVRLFVPKVRDAVAKVAALFAFIEGAPAVEPEHVARGIALGTYWIGEARNLVGSWGQAAGAYANAEKVLGWIQRRPDPVADFTVAEARKFAHLKGDDIVAALELLADYGYVRAADPVAGFGVSGRAVGKKSPAVEVNPQQPGAGVTHL